MTNIKFEDRMAIHDLAYTAASKYQFDKAEPYLRELAEYLAVAANEEEVHVIKGTIEDALKRGGADHVRTVAVTNRILVLTEKIKHNV